MTDRVLLEQALEALEEMGGGYSQNLIAALRERLAQPEQEPIVKWDVSAPLVVHPHPAFKDTQPQRNPWVGLTEDELWDLWNSDTEEPLPEWFVDFEQAYKIIEAKLKEKNNG